MQQREECSHQSKEKRVVVLRGQESSHVGGTAGQGHVRALSQFMDHKRLQGIRVVVTEHSGRIIAHKPPVSLACRESLDLNAVA